MLLDWKNKYENGYTIQRNLLIEFNPYHITYQLHIHYDITYHNGSFHRIRTKNIYNLYENTKEPEYPKHLEKEKWSWRNQALWLQTILQSYSHQDSLVMVQKQKYR